MSDHHFSEPFPKSALVAGAAVVTLTILAAAVGRLQHREGQGPDPFAGARPAAQAELRFADAPDGSVLVRDASDARTVAVLKPGQGGFVRGVMRGLALRRASLGVGRVPPFRLALAGQGQLWLRDEATGQLIDLNSFGVENRGAFLKLLAADRVRS